jgi:uncharacterized surface protein with fasciclin (FAS1) repeats
MTFSKSLFAATLMGVLAFSAVASVPTFAQTNNSSKPYHAKVKRPKLNSLDVVDRIAYYADMSTLVVAVQSAGLIDTLKGGDFTVLAPSNDAFAKLPAGTVETLVKPENKDTLTKILTYHVLPGKQNLKKMADGSILKTVLGQEFTLINSKSGLQIKDANGKVYDLSDKPYMQKNGNVYRIDEVLLPL